MTNTAQDFVRRTVGGILRDDRWRGKFLCCPCLEKLSREQLGAGYRESEIARALDQVFGEPGALDHMPTYQCARCLRTMPCLGVADR